MSTGRFFMGMLIFLIAAQLLAYVLAYVNAFLFHCKSTTQACGMAVTIAPVRSNVPILSGLQWFMLVYMLLTLGIWYLLYRFNIIPRDPWGVKARTAAVRAQTTTARSGASTGATAGRNRAARRAANPTATATPARRTTSSHRVVSGAHDDAYERVKAAQRARRRRAAKR
jgi:hypothetical protein